MLERDAELEALERAEAQINRLIERRAAEREQANAESAAWAESVQRYNAQRREAERLAWLDHHRRLAETHELLADEHRRKLGELIDQAATSQRNGAGGASYLE